VDRYLFVKVYPDAGIVGPGESGAHGFLEPSAAVADKFKAYLIGQDPLLIEHHLHPENRPCESWVYPLK